jgi:hypothetical protein
MYWIILAAIVVVLVVWWVRRRDRVGGQPPQPTRALPSFETRETDYTRPELPPGIEAAIVATLGRGDAPDEEWAAAGWSCRFQSVSGETFDNPNGTSRQAILAKARPGQECVLLAEPDNPHDTAAVAVYLLEAGGRTAQIGYLPRGHGFGAAVARGKVAAWLSSVGAPRKGAPLGAVLYVVAKD